jgi:hypothetical protein
MRRTMRRKAGETHMNTRKMIIRPTVATRLARQLATELSATTAHGSRLDTIGAMIEQPGGASVDEIAAALVAAWPRRTARLRQRSATFAEMRVYARSALAHLETGRVGRGKYKGKLVHKGERWGVKDGSRGR